MVLYYCNWKVWWLLLGLLALRPSVLSLLQTATAFFFGSGTRIITKCDRTGMSSNMFWFFLVEIFVKHLSSIRFHSLRITKMIFDFSGIVDWWWIYNDRFTVFFCVKFERAFAGFGDVDFEIRERQWEAIGCHNSFSYQYRLFDCRHSNLFCFCESWGVLIVSLWITINIISLGDISRLGNR